MDYKNIVISTLDLEKSNYLDKLVNQLSDTFPINFNSKELLLKYKDNHKGYSIHSLLIFNDNVVAAFTCMPRKIGNYSILVGCDTFVDRNHRKNIFILKDLYNTLLESSLNENYNIVLGVPNEKASLYWDKIAKWKIKTELDVVILPVINGFLKYFFAAIYFVIVFLFFSKKKNLIYQNIKHLNKFKDYISINNVYTKNYFESEKNLTYMFGFSNNLRLDLASSIFKSIIQNGNTVILIGNKNPLRKLRVNNLIKRKLYVHIEHLSDLSLENISFDLAILDNR
tara:strand:- start:1226 stop:2074 length:849 start_codon:yes stop_codon:yes gene_type:complete